MLTISFYKQFSMTHFNMHVVVFVLYVCVFRKIQAIDVDLYYRTRETNSVSTKSYFKVIGPTITDRPTLLEQYHKTDHGCSSAFQGAFLCNMDSDCNYFTFNENDATCSTYKLDGIGVVEDGL